MYRNKASLTLVVFSILILLLFKNPEIEKRNALGPIYLSLITIYFRDLCFSNLKSFLLLFLSMVLAFPVISVFTHGKGLTIDELYDIGVLGVLEKIPESFYQLHYDAFSNIIAAGYYIQDHGVSYGNQLVGAILFFIPRSFWVDKPLSSGMEVGDYLIFNYGFWFNNLSMPFIGEALLNFGFLGIIFFAVLLAYVVSLSGRWLRSISFLKHFIAIYFSYHLLFLLRGDLMNGIAYFVGPLVAIYFLPKLISNLRTNI